MYQEVISAIYGVKTLSVMDQTCFISDSKSLVNAMNCHCFERKFDIETSMPLLEKCMSYQERWRYKLVEIAGDYYFDVMSTEETVKKAVVVMDDEKTRLKNMDEINAFI